ncbi:MAG: helix-turn-helix domain-containing protein [Pirellulaceae bacterium]|nr:helix-turn-helix domain-containing protein [Pirellulaceae bacterium]
MNEERATSKRSVHANGPELKRLRACLGLTQEDLAAQIDYSDRVIRRAENGQRVDYRTLKTLHEFFVLSGLEVGFTEIVAGDSEATTEESPNLHRSVDLVSFWFDQIFHKRSVEIVNYLAVDDVTFCLNGEQGAGRKSLVGHLNKLLEEHVEICWELLQICSGEDWTMVQWQSQRLAGETHREHLRDFKWKLVSGITSFRLSDERIVEIWEFSNQVPSGKQVDE